MALNDRDDALDFDVSEDDVFPRGLCPAAVVAVERKPGDKADYLATQFEIQGGNWDSLIVYLNITLSRNPYARLRSRASIEAIVGRTLTNSENMPNLIREMHGRPCQVQMGKREFEGVMRPDVQKVLPARTAPGFLDPDAGSPGQPPAAPTPSSGVDALFQQADEEEIPF